jgi:hypothetical protein
MKKLLLLLLFIPLVSFGQTFKEIEKFHDNGNTAIETIKNSDLIIVQRNKYSENGTLISKFNIDPKSGLLEGEFIYNELSKNEEILNSSKGYLDKGLLNCDKCTIKVDVSNLSDDWIFTDFLNPKVEGIKFQGKFVNGKPVGKIKVFEYIEQTTRAGVDVIRTNINARLGIANVEYYYMGTGNMYKIPIGELNYNDNGYLDGLQVTSTESYPLSSSYASNNYKELIYKNGIPNEIYILEKENKNIYKDSIIRNAKIWKIDGKYVRNSGQLKFNFNEFDENFYWNYGSFYIPKPDPIVKLYSYSSKYPFYYNSDTNFNAEPWERAQTKINSSKTNNIILKNREIQSFNFVGNGSVLENLGDGVELNSTYSISELSYQPILIMGGYIEGAQKNGLKEKSYNVTNTAKRLSILTLPIILNEKNLFFKNYLIDVYYSETWDRYSLPFEQFITLNSYLYGILDNLTKTNKEELKLYKTLYDLPFKSFNNNNFFFKEYINSIIEIIDNRKLEILDILYYNNIDKTFINYKDFHLNQLNKIDSQTIDKVRSSEKILTSNYRNKILEFENLLNTLNDKKILISYPNDNLEIKERLKEILNSRNLTEFNDKQKENYGTEVFLAKFPPNSIIKGINGIEKILSMYNIFSTKDYIKSIEGKSLKELNKMAKGTDKNSRNFYYGLGLDDGNTSNLKSQYIEIIAKKGSQVIEEYSISTNVYSNTYNTKNSLFSFDSKIIKKYVNMEGFYCFKVMFNPAKDKFFLKAFKQAKEQDYYLNYINVLKELGTIGEITVPGLDPLPSNKMREKRETVAVDINLYTGKYTASYFPFPLVFKNNSGKLNLRLDKFQGDLTPLSTHKFEQKDLKAIITFNIEDRMLTYEINDSKLEFKKDN